MPGAELSAKPLPLETDRRRGGEGARKPAPPPPLPPSRVVGGSRGQGAAGACANARSDRSHRSPVQTPPPHAGSRPRGGAEGRWGLLSGGRRREGAGGVSGAWRRPGRLGLFPSGPPRPHFLQGPREAGGGERAGAGSSWAPPPGLSTPAGQRPRVREVGPVLGSPSPARAPKSTRGCGWGWAGPGRRSAESALEELGASGAGAGVRRAAAAGAWSWRGRGRSAGRWAGLMRGRGRGGSAATSPAPDRAPRPRPRAPPLASLPSRGWQAGRGDCGRRTGGCLRLAPSLAAGFLLFFWTAMSSGPVRRLRARGGPRS